MPDDSDANEYMVELLLENCFRSLLRYCAAQQLSAADLEWLLGSIAVEVTAPRNEITERSLIVLLSNDQGPLSLT